MTPFLEIIFAVGLSVGSRLDMPFAHLCPIDGVKPRDDDAHSSDGNSGGAIKRDPCAIDAIIHGVKIKKKKGNAGDRTRTAGGR